jgi:ABC-type transport system involved in Fe-S cluster assembly fused permease/ATPase subunit
MNESCRIWMSHVTHMNESYHTYKWVMSHIWMSHAKYKRVGDANYFSHSRTDAVFRYEGVMSHTNESCHTYEWVMSYIWMSHVTCKDSNHFLHSSTDAIFRHDMTHVCHVAFIHVILGIHMRDTFRSDAQHDSFMCEAWLVDTCDMTYPYMQSDSLIWDRSDIQMWGGYG